MGASPSLPLSNSFLLDSFLFGLAKGDKNVEAEIGPRRCLSTWRHVVVKDLGAFVQQRNGYQKEWWFSVFF